VSNLACVIVLTRLLNPATSYAIRVRGFTSLVNVGPYSRAVNVTTWEDRKFCFTYKYCLEVWFTLLCSFALKLLTLSIFVVVRTMPRSGWSTTMRTWVNVATAIGFIEQCFDLLKFNPLNALYLPGWWVSCCWVNSKNRCVFCVDLFFEDNLVNLNCYLLYRVYIVSYCVLSVSIFKETTWLDLTWSNFVHDANKKSFASLLSATHCAHVLLPPYKATSMKLRSSSCAAKVL